MKVVAYYALHYGKEWLYWSMRSIKDFVDDIVVVYSPTPSYGHGTEVACPDTSEQLKLLADRFDAHWVNIHRSHWEGDHRDEAVHICEDMGADIILVVDHDELWEPDMLKKSLEFVMSNSQRNYLVHMQHYWRSVGWVCYDEALPVRFIKPGGEGNISVPREYGNVHHFGYAQTVPIMAYKWLIHGHLAELRPNWFEHTFQTWKPGDVDVHPTNVDFWTPVRYDRTQIADLISDHPYYGMDIIP
jgi:hypothetical protein